MYRKIPVNHIAFQTITLMSTNLRGIYWE